MSGVSIFNEISDFTSFGKFEQFFLTLFCQNYLIIEFETIAKASHFGQLRFLDMERMQMWLKLWLSDYRFVLLVFG
jgi:hypothetical protein